MVDASGKDAAVASSYAWLVFAACGLFFILYGIYAFTLQYLQPEHWPWMTSDTTTTG